MLKLTANYHVTNTCNMNCRYCFAGFAERPRLDLSDSIRLLKMLGTNCSRINFAGGEPTTVPFLAALVEECRKNGMDASLITNGFYMVHKADLLSRLAPYVSLIGISIDSVHRRTHIKLGRSVRGEAISTDDYLRLIDNVNANEIEVKINTVVTTLNCAENMSDFLRRTRPKRWKVLQMLPIAEENGREAPLAATDGEFKSFVRRHRTEGADPIDEDNDIMTGSYLMISPDGRFFNNTGGCYSFSQPILEIGFEEALRQVNFDGSRYANRYHHPATFLRHSRIAAITGERNSALQICD